MLLISDGRPGHYRQSEGVVASLSRRGPIVVDRLEIGLRLPLPKALVPKLGRLLPPGWFLPAVHGVAPGRMEKPDIIVSAGGATLAAHVGLARVWNVANVFSGSTRGFALDRFRLVLTPYASVAEPPKVVAGPQPTPFDPDRVPFPRPIQSTADMRGARVSILIGGPTWYAAFEPDDWRRLASLAEALVEKLGCRLTIVTSPRTPSAAYDHVLPLAGKLAGAVSLIDFRTAGPGSIERSFDCDLVLVTSDSMSMMTEAALSRRPAVALVPDKVKPARDDEAVAGLVAERWLATLPLASADADGLASLAASLEPLDGNHLDRLAAVVCAATGLDAS